MDYFAGTIPANISRLFAMTLGIDQVPQQLCINGQTARSTVFFNITLPYNTAADFENLLQAL